MYVSRVILLEFKLIFCYFNMYVILCMWVFEYCFVFIIYNLSEFWKIFEMFKCIICNLLGFFVLCVEVFGVNLLFYLNLKFLELYY